MAEDRGKFCWYELLTPDMAAAARFYGDVVGWASRDSGNPKTPYTLFTVGETPVAGLMTLTDDMKAAGGRPGWMGYIAVEDVDRSLAKLVEKGGVKHCDPEDIPHVGRFAVVADPQGAYFVLFREATGSMAPPKVAPGTVGYAGWRELMAKDWETAFDFYADMFGWTKHTAVEMGDMGTYQTFAVHGEQTGGLMTLPPGMPAPFWTYYFNVDSVTAAVDRITGAGGKVINGPMEVPGGQWIVQGMDPQGAMFALLSPKT
jgi:predicted enzyme related to lactoylglutathione lyase